MLSEVCRGSGELGNSCSEEDLENRENRFPLFHAPILDRRVVENRLVGEPQKPDRFASMSRRSTLELSVDRSQYLGRSRLIPRYARFNKGVTELPSTGPLTRLSKKREKTPAMPEFSLFSVGYDSGFPLHQSCASSIVLPSIFGGGCGGRGVSPLALLRVRFFSVA